MLRYYYFRYKWIENIKLIKYFGLLFTPFWLLSLKDRLQDLTIYKSQNNIKFKMKEIPLYGGACSKDLFGSQNFF